MATDLGEPVTSGWHLDKRVPIALVLAIMVQSAGMVWWGATLSARVATLEEKSVAGSGQPERLVKVETQVEGLTKTMDRIERKLDRALDPPTRE